MNRLLLGLLMLNGGCGEGDDDPRVGGDGDADSDADADGDSDGDADGDPDAEAIAAGAVRGLADVVALAAPMRGDGATLHEQRDGANEQDAQTLVEHAVARDSVVVDGGCTTFAWDGLSVSITFASCTAEETGVPLDGTVTLAVSINPTTFTFTFTDLTIDATMVDGSVSLSVSGGGDLGGGVARTSVSADLAIDDVHLVLTDLTIAGSAAAYTLSGAGTIQTPSVDADLTLSDVAWSTGDCRPSGGSIGFDSASVSGTMEFTATTPEDGIVWITVAPWPAYEYVLPPCGQE